LTTDSGRPARSSLRAKKSGQRVSRAPAARPAVLWKPSVIESPNATTAPVRPGATTSMPLRNGQFAYASPKAPPPRSAVWSPTATYVDGSDASGWVVAVPVALRAYTLPP
jgi:hypothetical protein